MKKLLTALIALSLLAVPALGLGEIIKDETVYALLTASGVEKTVYVVSHIDTPEDGEYTDHGTYASVAPMTRAATPVIDGNTVTWTLPTDPEGFYAIGKMDEAQLPCRFELAYTLGGAEIDAKDLAGQSGQVTLTLRVQPNPNAGEAFRTRYAVQAQIPLSLAHVSDIDAPGAAGALVGQTRTLTYTVLPGQEAEFTLSFTARDFQMDSITIALAPMDIGGMLGIDLSELITQAEALVSGTHQLADGAAALETNLNTMLTALATLNEGAQALASAQAQVADGVTAYVSGAETALATIAEQAATLNTSVTALIAQLPEAMRLPFKQLADGVSAFAQGTSDAYTQVSAGGAQLLTGLTAQTEGTATYAAGMQQLSDGLTALPAGLTAQTEGTAQLAAGLDTVSTYLDDFSALTATDTIPSFASPEHPARTVQFVYMTEAITKPAEAGAPVQAEAAKTFWDRLADLFK